MRAVKLLLTQRMVTQLSHAMGSEKELRRAVFDRDVVTLRRMRVNAWEESWIGKYKPLFQLNRNSQHNEATLSKLQSADPFVTGCALEWLGWIAHSLQIDPLSPAAYMKLYQRVTTSLYSFVNYWSLVETNILVG